jgi:hypothetical protein
VVIVLEYKDKLLKNFLGCRLWHGKSTMDYPEQPTFIVLRPEKRFKLENLTPSTEYSCKAFIFSIFFTIWCMLCRLIVIVILASDSLGIRSRECFSNIVSSGFYWSLRSTSPSVYIY